MSEEVRIEPATQEDLAAVLECWVALVAGQRSHGTHLLHEENRETAREFISQQIAAGSVLVAREHSQVVGFATAHIERGAFAQDETRGLIENLFVRDSARSRGIGTKLLRTAEQQLAAEGATVFSIEALADNDRARDLYQAAGYTAHRITYERPASDTHSREADG